MENEELNDEVVFPIVCQICGKSIISTIEIGKGWKINISSAFCPEHSEESFIPN